MKGKRGGAKIGTDFLARESPSEELINFRKEQKAKSKARIKKLEFAPSIGELYAIKERKYQKND